MGRNTLTDQAKILSKGFRVRIGFNLRGDLTCFDLQEIEDKLNDLLDERKNLSDSISDVLTVGNKSLYQSGYGMPFGRGLLHAKIFYNIAAFFYRGSHKRGLGRLYVIDCELKDLMDECRRRLRYS